MFDRRHTKSLFHKTIDLLWPRIGIKRALRYHWLRLVHHPASSKNLAAGFALGAAISCTPLIGLHLVITLLVCFIFRLNLWSAALGTTLGNPWTFPFIWSFTYYLGTLIMPSPAQPLAISTLSWSSLISNSSDIFLPMLIGCIPLSLLVWFISYKLLTFFLDKHKKRK